MLRKTSKLAAALVLVLGLGAAIPTAAEASHRHSRYCRHGSGYYDSGYGYDSGYNYGYNRGYDYGYSPRYYSYEYRYRPRPYYDSYYDPYPRYYYAPRRPRVYVHFHDGHRCTRSHVSFSFGF